MTSSDPARQRQQMVAQIAAHAAAVGNRIGRPALDPRVMEVMSRLPRHSFVPVPRQAQAYEDRPLPIGCDKTISQPFIVALMSDLLDLRPTHRVLEIGTGLGYQTAVLASLVQQVYSIERLAPLAGQARRNLDAQDIDNVQTRIGNGLLGWPEQAPFDRIIATGAPATIPPALLAQLGSDGVMVLPVGPAGGVQQLVRLVKGSAGHMRREDVLEVRFSELEDSEAQ